ncbi:hypothetical protein RclHR1_02880020 [Rhizophagus clarus]|uniref:Uncharacterized protein n=1 Tax=Rhizophagus clarus TaxID=94130 RepID=A0A2Z6RG04_9GLOM|nr:hypothetical protein RclHR1_02880020 [Rhizophagus clarus]
MFRSFFASMWAKIHSRWAFTFRKIKMTEILLNCLVISNNLIGKSTVQDIVAVEIDSKRSIHFLREAIRKAYAPPV